MNLRQLPNAITLARIALVPLLVALMHAGEHRAVFWVALAASASDALDGGLARRYGWQTRLGALLDPIADKLLIAACFVGLWSIGLVPDWLLALVLGRDLLIVGGALVFHWLIAPLQARPSWPSKITTVAQIAFALGWITWLAWREPHTPIPLHGAVSNFGNLAVAALTLASGAHYVWVWGRRASREHAARRR
jgi:cardiolipin synthase